MNSLLLSLILLAPLPKELREPPREYRLAVAYLSGREDYGPLDAEHPDLKAICQDTGLMWLLAELNKSKGVRWGVHPAQWGQGNGYATLWWLNNLRNNYHEDPWPNERR